MYFFFNLRAIFVVEQRNPDENTDKQSGKPVTLKTRFSLKST